MLYFLHSILMAVYIALPAVLFIRAAYLRVVRHRRRPWARLRFVMLGGALVGLMISSVYAVSMHGKMIVSQVLLTGYFAVSMLLLLKGFDRALWHLSRKLFATGGHTSSRFWFEMRVTAALGTRAGLLFCVGLPFLMSAALTYRPKVAFPGNPQSLYGWSYESIWFPSTDGLKLSAWWIPSRRGISPKTVVLCHGQSDAKSTQLFLSKQLMEGGYNVLTFDFRAHGESGGQLTSFGDLERRDVLGAVRWLRANHPDACETVVGVGVSTGGAALIGAASDPGLEGQNIDAIAVYGTFDRVDHVAMTSIGLLVPRPVLWLVQHLGLPMADLQVGSKWSKFSVAEASKAIWPRPILVIHGMNDEVIPFERGQELFDAALQPKMNFWIERSSNDETLRNETAGKIVKRFFDRAVRML